MIFGAGGRAEEFIAFLKKYGIFPEFILVSDCNCNPQTVEEIAVKRITDIKERVVDNTLVFDVTAKL